MMTAINKTEQKNEASNLSFATHTHTHIAEEKWYIVAIFICEHIVITIGDDISNIRYDDDDDDVQTKQNKKD